MGQYTVPCACSLASAGTGGDETLAIPAFSSLYDKTIILMLMMPMMMLIKI